MAHVLVVDDLQNVRSTLALQLREAGHQVVEADGGRSALKALGKGVYDLVLTDLRMDEVDGLSVLKEVKKASPATEVIVMTAYGTVESGVAAMKAGAHDYLTKPVRPAELRIVVGQALEKRRLGDRIERLQAAGLTEPFLGESPAFQALKEQVRKVAPTDATVLLLGESGVGKEVVANLLHSSSARKDQPLLEINLGALSETLQESELFGHVRGSFTGATSTRKGIFAEADGSTLFLDEVGEAVPSTQVKLLRVLAEGEVRPVGGDRDVHVDVRVVAATNANLPELVTTGAFREDLFFRLNVFPIRVPPLRERREDIGGLAHHLLARHCAKLGRPPTELTTEALQALERYDWPGNVRELENVLERTLILHASGPVTADELPLVAGASAAEPASAALGDRVKTLAEVEREHVLAVLERCGGQRQRAAEALGIARATLFRKLKDYGVN